jgi:hypothetical protein
MLADLRECDRRMSLASLFDSEIDKSAGVLWFSWLPANLPPRHDAQDLAARIVFLRL